MKDYLQVPKTFTEKLADARAEKSICTSNVRDAKEWGTKSQLMYYITQLMDVIQELHPEFVTHVHNGRKVTAPKWSIQQKSRRMQCMRFGHFALDVQHGKHELIETRLCMQRTCPTCSKIIANRNERAIMAGIEDIQAKKYSRDKAYYKYLQLTLTVPNCTGPELKRELKNISKSITEMLRKSTALKGLWYHAIVGLEVTRNMDTGLFHPHAHVILLVAASYGKKAYLSRKMLTDEWAKYSHRQVALAAQKVQLVKKPHQAIKYVTKIAKWQGEPEDEDAAAEEDEAIMFRGPDNDPDKDRENRRFDAETLYWIITATHGMSTTKLYKTPGVSLSKAENPEITDEDLAELENDKHIYMLQHFQRIAHDIIIDGQSDSLLNKQGLLIEKARLKAIQSESSKAAWDRRRAIEQEANWQRKEKDAYMERKQTEASHAALEEVRKLAEAGAVQAAAKELRKCTVEEDYREGLQVIADS